MLGSVTFSGLEVPERIVLPGGAPTIHTHQLLPGQPVDIFWHAALSRFRSVDNLRHSGREVALTFTQFFMIVGLTLSETCASVTRSLRNQLPHQSGERRCVPMGSNTVKLSGLKARAALQ